MAATNVVKINGDYNANQTCSELPTLKGTGAPADGDVIATNITDYPIGTTYINTTAGKVYTRVAIAGVAADYAILN
jgi:hypothetical protein